MSQDTKKSETPKPDAKFTRVGVIFTDGAFCAPLKRKNPETGEMEWVWIVTDFTEDSVTYMDGHPVVPEYRADDRESLISDFLGHTPEEKHLFSDD